jgi:pyridoxal phosphate enzyme (YggS family)
MDNSISYEEFSARADAILSRIGEICRECGRSPEGVRLMAVTKTHGAWATLYAEKYGLCFVGENRVQEAEAKRATRPGEAGIRWELIGSLQTNKAKNAAALFDRVQSVDSAKLARELDKRAAQIGRVLPVLLQVNAGRDPAKHGCEIEEAPALLEAALALPKLKVEGLMTIAPLSGDQHVASRTFAKLREIRDELSSRHGVTLPELSMGMSGDMEEAVREGSTLVRIGTALFGARDYGNL